MGIVFEGHVSSISLGEDNAGFSAYSWDGSYHVDNRRSRFATLDIRMLIEGFEWNADTYQFIQDGMRRKIFLSLSEEREGERMELRKDKFNYVQYLVYKDGEILDSGFEVVTGKDDVKYRISKAVQHGEDAELWYKVLHYQDAPKKDEVADLLRQLLAERESNDSNSNGH